MEKKFTNEEIRNYINSQDSMGDIAYNLSEENIIKANLNIYQENGYDNRYDYLKSLADDYDIPYMIVKEAADMLGEDEDFDGLISSLEDYNFDNPDLQEL